MVVRAHAYLLPYFVKIFIEKKMIVNKGLSYIILGY